ncbi:hypothetical protein, partial [uncultured Desulfovibrio sp.]|uniref:hypothetical protein n=1 Tax=uncultured Desulfovibrio sp. TaxID=167968 RepID=UPI002606ADFA
MPGSIRGPAEEKGAMFQRKNRCPRQGQAEATKQGKEKVFRSERARKRKQKGEKITYRKFRTFKNGSSSPSRLGFVCED